LQRFSLISVAWAAAYILRWVRFPQKALPPHPPNSPACHF